jgi:predicted nucleotidyltransferase component of viral defense system
MTDPDYTVDFPSILDMPSANIRAYSPATVAAEKFQAIVELGMVNSRMKDYYDLWVIHNAGLIKAKELDASIQATFARRDTDIPEQRPIGLSDDFVNDKQKNQQWDAYITSIDLEGLSLGTVVEKIWSLIGPVCERLNRS